MTGLSALLNSISLRNLIRLVRQRTINSRLLSQSTRLAHLTRRNSNNKVVLNTMIPEAGRISFFIARDRIEVSKRFTIISRRTRLARPTTATSMTMCVNNYQEDTNTLRNGIYTRTINCTLCRISTLIRHDNLTRISNNLTPRLLNRFRALFITIRNSSIISTNDTRRHGLRRARETATLCRRLKVRIRRANKVNAIVDVCARHDRLRRRALLRIGIIRLRVNHALNASGRITNGPAVRILILTIQCRTRRTLNVTRININKVRTTGTTLAATSGKDGGLITCL